MHRRWKFESICVSNFPLIFKFYNSKGTTTSKNPSSLITHRKRSLVWIWRNVENDKTFTEFSYFSTKYWCFWSNFLTDYVLQELPLCQKSGLYIENFFLSIFFEKWQFWRTSPYFVDPNLASLWAGLVFKKNS